MEETLTSLSDYPLARGDDRAERTSRLKHPLRAFAAAAAVLGAVSLLLASEPHSDAIRGDLAAAASRLRDMPENASAARIDSALASEFTGENVTIDSSGFPAAVAVTLHSLDRASCVAALRAARRLEGRVVIELQGYGSSAQCGGNNDMTWRLMP